QDIEVGLVVAGVDRGPALVAELVGQDPDGMVHGLGGDLKVPDLEGLLAELGEFDPRGELDAADREVAVLHLEHQRFLERLLQRARPGDEKLVPRKVDRGEKWKTLDMVPAGVGKE